MGTVTTGWRASDRRVMARERAGLRMRGRESTPGSSSVCPRKGGAIGYPAMNDTQRLSAVLLAAALLGLTSLAGAAAPAGKKPAAHKPAGGAVPAPSDVAAPPADAETTASGLASKVLRKGTGTVHPGPADRVKVHYTGWTTDGKMFVFLVVRVTPLIFGLIQA